MSASGLWPSDAIEVTKTRFGQNLNGLARLSETLFVHTIRLVGVLQDEAAPFVIRSWLSVTNPRVELARKEPRSPVEQLQRELASRVIPSLAPGKPPPSRERMVAGECEPFLRQQAGTPSHATCAWRARQKQAMVYLSQLAYMDLSPKAMGALGSTGDVCLLPLASCF